QRQTIRARTLKRVAAHDRPEAAALLDLAQLREHLFGALGRPAREDDHALTVETRLHDVANTVGERRDRQLLVVLLRLGLLDVRAGRLHLDDVPAELASQVRRVRDHVERGLAVLADLPAARVRPDDRGQTVRARLRDQLADLLVHRVALARAR